MNMWISSKTLLSTIYPQGYPQVDVDRFFFDITALGILWIKSSKNFKKLNLSTGSNTNLAETESSKKYFL